MHIVYYVSIRPCEDTSGYYAVCDLPNGGCTVQGDTLHETQRNMMEAIGIFLDEDVADYFLNFEVVHA